MVSRRSDGKGNAQYARRDMMLYLVPIGLLMIFIGFFLVVFGSLASQGSGVDKAGDGSKVSWGVGGFIGPIPFGFATSKTMLYAIIGFAAFIFVLWILLRYTAN